MPNLFRSQIRLKAYFLGVIWIMPGKLKWFINRLISVTPGKLKWFINRLILIWVGGFEHAFPIDLEYPHSKRRFKVGMKDFWRHLEAGQWEPGAIEVMQRQIHQGSTVLDVGAWLGPYTLLISSIVGDSGRVIAFEPDPIARKGLARNLRLNGITNVTLESTAVGNVIGFANLSARQFGESGSSVFWAPKGSEHIKVAVTTIDSYCGSRGIAPDFIKIDVEGAEDLVISGATQILGRFHPEVLVEFHALFMSGEEKRTKWRAITGVARNVQVIDSSSKDFKFGDELRRGEGGYLLPNCDRFSILMKT